MPRIRVLYAWEGNDRSWPPLTVVDADEEIVRDRVPAGHAEVVDDDTPLTAELVAEAEEQEQRDEGGSDDDADAALSGDSASASAGDDAGDGAGEGGGGAPAVLAILDGRVGEVADAVQEITSPEELATLRAAEAAQRRPRAGVLSAIDERVETLAGDGDGDDS